MKAMVLEALNTSLKLRDLDVPRPKNDQILIKIEACGVCRTDLHVVDGELSLPVVPIIPGHQIVGEVIELGREVKEWHIGERAGVPWMQGACGQCKFCLSKRENLCEEGVFTGYQINGGFAEYCVADSAFSFHLPKNEDPIHLAPLLCGGLVGYRAFRLAKDAQVIGFYGFGSAAHVLIQIAAFQDKEIVAFTKPGDLKGQEFARELGAIWAGGSDELPPSPIDAAIIFAPLGELVPQALKAVEKGGKVICAGIHMSDIPSFPYDLLFDERSIQSVSNLTREDGIEFFHQTANIPLRTHVKVYPLEEANQALEDLRHGRFEGSAVLSMGS